MKLLQQVTTGRSPAPRRVMLYGTHGIGKSTLLLQALHSLLDDVSSALILGALDDVYRLASLGQGGADLNHPLSLAERARLPATREELVAAPARAAEARRDLAQDWLAPVALGEASPALAVHIGLWRQSLLRRGIEPIAGPLLAWRGWRMARKARGPLVSR